MEQIKCYTSMHTIYPKRLQCCTDPPGCLYVKGSFPLDGRPSAAIVGARMCSNYGKEQAYAFARELARAGVQIISGMARGVDGHAHRGALEGGGSTFAVLGCGADVCYPRENYDIYRKIPAQGGILTEYPPGSPPRSQNFPKRNRIISALADIILVVEARRRSGSLITADLALEQGKSVYALPGRVDDVLSEGCNWLISQGAQAALSPAFLLEELGLNAINIEETQKKNNFRLERKKEMVYSCLDLQPKNLSSLTEKLPLTVEEVSSILIELELDGWITEPMKNYYVRKK